MGWSISGLLGAIAERYGLELTAVVNPKVDPAWSFMTLDWDGRSGAWTAPLLCNGFFAMRRRPEARTRTETLPTTLRPVTMPTRTVTNRDPDGLMNPNHYLAAAIEYLSSPIARTGPQAAVGKTWSLRHSSTALLIRLAESSLLRSRGLQVLCSRFGRC